MVHLWLLLLWGGVLRASSSAQFSKRFFHPAFPLEILRPVSVELSQEVARVRDLLKAADSGDDWLSSSNGLPWMPLPSIGISDSQKIWSRREIDEAWERNRHLAQEVWAEKLDKPEKGCVLLNHWKQTACLLTEYDARTGARGYEIRGQTGPTDFISWPPLALETELIDKRWQAVRVSENLMSGVFQLLPPQMPKAPWELVFLLLLEPSSNSEELQALFDTGLSPRQGLIAYMRLLQQVLLRSEGFNDVPSWRKITELTIERPYENMSAPPST